jgi:hypothetical protein
MTKLPKTKISFFKVDISFAKSENLVQDRY